MNQEQLLKSIAGEGLGWGFFIGETLPNEPGKLSEILVVNIAAEPNILEGRIVRNIISAISKQPVAKNREQRDRQLRKLIETAYVEYRHVAIVIRNAHHLPPRTIKQLKILQEGHNNHCPGIALIGDKEKIIKKVERTPAVYQRALEITKEGDLIPIAKHRL